MFLALEKPLEHCDEVRWFVCCCQLKGWPWRSVKNRPRGQRRSMSEMIATVQEKDSVGSGPGISCKSTKKELGWIQVDCPFS